MKKVLLMAMAITWASSHNPTPVLADSMWTGLSGNSDFNDAGNWMGGVPTNDNGVFDTASPTNISLSASVSVTTFTFNSGAAAYTFTVSNGVSLDFHIPVLAGSMGGISNHSMETQTLNISNGGTLSFTNNSTAGNAVINNAGTLTFSLNTFLTGGSSTAGNATIVNTGLMDFSGGASGGNAYIVNLSTIQLRFASGSPTLGNATVVNDGLIDSSSVNNGWSVGSIEGSGNIQLGPQPFTIGSNGLSTAIMGVISGPGTLTKTGLGTLTLAGTNTYTGLTTIVAGGLSVSGSLTSDVAVSSSGTLSGTGRVGNVTNGGTVSPGSNGVGSLSVATYSGHGALNILINGASVPTLNVLGAADITGGTVTVSGSHFSVGQYNILQSNALTGTFATVNSPGSLFLIAPVYTDTDVRLRISFATPFATLAQTTNQRNLASNIEEFKTTTTPEYTQAITSLAQLPVAQIPNAFNQLSGDALVSFQEINFQNATVFNKGMRQRAVNISSGSYGLWAQGMGWRESVDGNSSMGSPATHATMGGFQAGYDYALAEGLLIGMSGGYGKTSVDVMDRDSTGDATSIHSGLYAQYAQEGWQTSAGTALTSASNHMTRTFHYGTFDGNATARFASRLFSSFVETRYALHPQESLTVFPSLSLRHTHLGQDAFTESGGSGLDLAVEHRSFNSLKSGLGASLNYSFDPHSSSRSFIALTAAWEHEWSDNENSLSARFANTDGGGNYTVHGTPRDRNAAAIGFHGEVPLKGCLALFTDYNATLGSAQTLQSILGGVRVTW